MPGTQFIGDELLKQVGANFARRIQRQQDILDGTGQPTDEELLIEWRNKAEKQVLELAERLRDVPDHELAAFRVLDTPTVGYWRKSNARDAQRAIERLEQERDLSLAFISALATDAEGVVELRAADLRRIGYPA